ncbi:hypothetical protein LXL04_009903 [Taraxacum kok-saghyz]
MYEQWASLTQTGSTSEYIQRFVELAAPLEGVTDRVALASFIKGLNPTIQNELRLWAPTELGRAMDLTQQIEEKNRALRSSGFGSLGSRNPTHPRNNQNNQATLPISNSNRTGGSYRRNIGENRPLTMAQINEKRVRGLCYKCDELWNRNHRCKSQINVILIEEEE